ncbi:MULTISPECIES: anti-sigma regulatory factor [unclassified Achromobacter]|uniref:anti-sigma regulatory factor n=1 Tax=unclassified Achromobacter TaxID=2626865 RepID=UPI000B51A3FC|nr:MULTISPECIES: anti-sigma regulatory factor [unclassified Achromobacter]OWT71344.1 anti-sigma regulatory factor [Achromobacter sp. HZ34]OWT73309.1 anti-sigma regulatory factor [Achromobacter sp. HZ28]
MTGPRQAILELSTQDQLAIARRTVQEWATTVGFGTLDRTKIVTAASEIGRNTLVHGGGGRMTITEVTNENFQQGLRLVFEDQGPGIPDIDRALTDGYTTAKSMGLGFGGAKRLVNEFDVHSEPGQGTTVTLTQWKRR